MRVWLLAWVGIAAAAVPCRAAEAWVRVRVVGLRNGHGNVLISLFQGPEGFPGQPEKACRKVALPATGTREALFEGLPEGTYAVAVCHDENGTLRLETSLLGRPKEGVGFSNDVHSHWRPPGFREASFVLTREGKELTVRVVY